MVPAGGRTEHRPIDAVDLLAASPRPRSHRHEPSRSQRHARPLPRPPRRPAGRAVRCACVRSTAPTTCPAGPSRAPRAPVPSDDRPRRPGARRRGARGPSRPAARLLDLPPSLRPRRVPPPLLGAPQPPDRDRPRASLTVPGARYPAASAAGRSTEDRQDRDHHEHAGCAAWPRVLARRVRRPTSRWFAASPLPPRHARMCSGFEFGQCGGRRRAEQRWPRP